MATLEELVVSIVAETSGLRAELDKATKATMGATEKMDKAISEFSKNSSKDISFFQTAMATATGFLGSQAVLGAFNSVKAAAGALFNELVVNGVKAAIDQEDALNQLNIALSLTGKYSKSTSDELNQFAASLQQTTRYQDTAILSAASLIQTLGDLDKDGLKRATQAAVDLSAALGKDLNTTATLVGKAAAGNVASFEKFGISIQQGATKAETFANMLSVVERRLGGAAAAQVKTFSGLTDQLANSWSEFTEVVGESIVKNQALLNVLAEVNRQIIGDTESLDANKEVLKELVAQGLILFIDGLIIATSTLDIFARMVQFGGTVIDLFNGNFQEAAKNIQAFGEEGDNVFNTMTDRLADLKGAAEAGLTAMELGFQTATERSKSTKDAIVELSDEQKRQNDNLKAYAQGLADSAMSVETYYANETAIMKENLNLRLVSQEEYWLSREELLAAQHAAEQAQLDLALNNRLISEETYNNASTALTRKQAADAKKLADEKLKFEQTASVERLKISEQMFGNLATLANSSSKELAMIGKAAAITEATIQGIRAVQSSYAWGSLYGGPALGTAFAVTAGIATAANVAKIAGVGLNKGGTLRGGGANTDRIPVVGTPGETMVDRSTTENLKEFLANNQNGMNGGTVVIELSLKDELVEMIEAKIIKRQQDNVSLIQRAN